MSQLPAPWRHTIPFLPTDHPLYGDLSTVPDQDDYGVPGEEPRPWTQAELILWEQWRDNVIRYRIERTAECRGNPREQAIERDRCRQSKAYWLTMYCWVQENRRQGGRGGDIPAVPYPHILDIHLWIDERIDHDPELGFEDNHGYLSKPRDMQASWAFAQDASWRWLWEDTFRGLILSYKQELVDSASPTSVFYKVGYTLGWKARIAGKYPKWLLPKNFNHAEHKKINLLENPENGNTLSGDSTTSNSARGDRPTVIYGDEFAFWPDGGDVAIVAQSSTDHLLLGSTESFKVGDHHWTGWHVMQEDDRRRDDGTHGVLELDWWRHPYHSFEWFERKKRDARANPEKFANEVERNPYTGAGEYVYPEIDSAITGHFPWEPDNGDVWFSIDPGVNDRTFIWAIQEDIGTGLLNVVDCYWNSQKPSVFYVGILTGVPGSRRGMEYDEDAFEFMEMSAAIVDSKVVGDPSGDARGGSGDTFYSAFRRKGINIRTSRKAADWEHRSRHDATHNILPRLRWHDSPRVQEGLRMVSKYKWPKNRGKSTNRVSSPIHDDNSHAATALEFFAVNYDMARRKRTGKRVSEQQGRQSRFTHQRDDADYGSFDRAWNAPSERSSQARFSRRRAA